MSTFLIFFFLSLRTPNEEEEFVSNHAEHDVLSYLNIVFEAFSWRYLGTVGARE